MIEEREDFGKHGKFHIEMLENDFHLITEELNKSETRSAQETKKEPIQDVEKTKIEPVNLPEPIQNGLFLA